MGNVMNQVVAAAGETSGLVDATFDVAAGRLVIHWHDDVPPRVQAVLDEAADAPFEVVVEPARSSRGALQAEVRRLRAGHPGKDGPPGGVGERGEHRAERVASASVPDVRGSGGHGLRAAVR